MIRALCFDVFGTVVDWRSTIIREGETFRPGLDWAGFADAWRAGYEPAMDRVRRGELPWTPLDDLHRTVLDGILERFGLADLDEATRDRLNRVWHRLDPWPDALSGMAQLRKKYILASLSNGNVALIVDMAKHAGIPWDAVLGAEVARAYKPLPEAYLTTARLLGCRPEQCMMVAAHNKDLRASAAFGFKTAFVARPTEHGPGQKKDLAPDGAWDIVAADFVDLAAKLGC